MRRLASFVAVTACLLTPIAGFASPTSSLVPKVAGATQVDGVRLNSFEASLLSDMNLVRRAHHLPALTVAPGTTDVARRWTWKLAKMQQLEHNPHLIRDLEKAGSPNWRAIEENVGYGPSASPEALFTAYMNSPPHRANILGPAVRYVGVGVVQRGDTAYNTVDFVDSYSSSYGLTRVPAGSITQDAQALTASTTLATARQPDERFGPAAKTGMHASRLHFGHRGARARFHGHKGAGTLVFRQAVSLANVTQLQVQLAASNPRHRALRVAIRLSDSWGQRTIDKVNVFRSRTVTMNLPNGDHGVLSSLSFRVTGQRLKHAGGKATLTVSNVRAIV